MMQPLSWNMSYELSFYGIKYQCQFQLLLSENRLLVWVICRARYVLDWLFIIIFQIWWKSSAIPDSALISPARHNITSLVRVWAGTAGTLDKIKLMFTLKYVRPQPSNMSTKIATINSQCQMGVFQFPIIFYEMRFLISVKK